MSVLAAYMRPSSKSEIVKVNLRFHIIIFVHAYESQILLIRLF